MIMLLVARWTEAVERVRVVTTCPLMSSLQGRRVCQRQVALLPQLRGSGGVTGHERPTPEVAGIRHRTGTPTRHISDDITSPQVFMEVLD